MTPMPGYGRPRDRLTIGSLWIDRLTFAEALDEIGTLVESGRGGRVFTPNLDHVVLANDNAAFRAAYAAAELSRVDGTPRVWAARLLVIRLPDKISGSDLVWPLLDRAGRAKWRVYLLGGAEGVGAEAAEVMRRRCGVNVVGIDAPRVATDGQIQDAGESLARIRPGLPDSRK